MPCVMCSGHGLLSTVWFMICLTNRCPASIRADRQYKHWYIAMSLGHSQTYWLWAYLYHREILETIYTNWIDKIWIRLIELQQDDGPGTLNMWPAASHDLISDNFMWDLMTLTKSNSPDVLAAIRLPLAWYTIYSSSLLTYGLLKEHKGHTKGY